MIKLYPVSLEAYYTSEPVTKMLRMACKRGRNCGTNTLFAIASCMWLIMPLHVWSQTTDVVILNAQEMTRVESAVAENAWAKSLYDSIVTLTQSSLNDAPAPLEVIYYEGLLDTDARRIATLKSLADIDHVEPSPLHHRALFHQNKTL